MAHHTNKAIIYDMDEHAITDGTQGNAVADDPIRAAERIADREGCDVILGDAGARWIVHPMINGVRVPAGWYEGNK
jgi:hypothetical protein